jgi:hypothetical protein
MLTLFISFFIQTASFAQKSHEVDWQQPGIGCIEDLYLHRLKPSEKCADLQTTSINAQDLSADAHGICSAREVIRRETLKPGSQPKDLSLFAWLMLHSLIDREEKIQAIYNAAENTGMPPQFLYGILELESKITDLGITVDSENYSCGTGSLNLTQWCEWMTKQDEITQRVLGWPAHTPCDDRHVAASLVGSVFHQVFDENTPWITQMDSSRYAKVDDRVILAELKKLHPQSSYVLRKKQLSAIRSFTNHCFMPGYSIPATAFSIKKIYDELIPEYLKVQQRFLPGQAAPISCLRSYRSEYFPMHPGWMLAYAAHNMGDEAVDIFDYYFREERQKNPMRTFTAQDVIDGLFWGGKLSTIDGKQYITHYQNSSREPQSIDFFWPCIAHSNVFNVADRMMNHSNPNPLHRDLPGACRAIEERIQSSGIY